MSKKRSVKVQRIDSDDPFVKYLFPFLVMYSWLHEEEFDEQMATLEADPDGTHSLVYSDIDPFLVMLTVGSSLPLRIALSTKTSSSFSWGISECARRSAPRLYTSAFTTSPSTRTKASSPCWTPNTRSSPRS